MQDSEKSYSVLNITSSSIETFNDTNTMFPTEYHTTDKNANVGIKVNDNNILRCSNLLQSVEPITI